MKKNGKKRRRRGAPTTKKKFRYRLDYFVSYFDGETPGGGAHRFFQQKDVLTHLASFCDDHRLGMLCSLTRYLRFVFGCDAAWQHLPHDPDDGEHQRAGYLDLPIGWQTWPPYALKLPPQTPVKYKRAYYLAVRLGLRPSLVDTGETIKKMLKYATRNANRLLKCEERDEKAVALLQTKHREHIQEMENDFFNIERGDFEDRITDMRYILSRLKTLRHRHRFHQSLLNIYQQKMESLATHLAVLVGRLRRTHVFAMFLKEGVWSMYDIWDEEEAICGKAVVNAENGYLIMSAYCNRLPPAGNVDWRLQRFEEHDTAIGESYGCPAGPHFPCNCSCNV